MLSSSARSHSGKLTHKEPKSHGLTRQINYLYPIHSHPRGIQPFKNHFSKHNNYFSHYCNQAMYNLVNSNAQLTPSHPGTPSGEH